MRITFSEGVDGWIDIIGRFTGWVVDLRRDQAVGPDTVASGELLGFDDDRCCLRVHAWDEATDELTNPPVIKTVPFVDVDELYVY